MNSNIVYIALPLIPFSIPTPEKEKTHNKSAKSVMPTNILFKWIC